METNSKNVQRVYLNDLLDGLPRWRQHTTRLASVSGSLASCISHTNFHHTYSKTTNQPWNAISEQQLKSLNQELAQSTRRKNSFQHETSL